MVKDFGLEGLPVNLDAERFILGSILLDSRRFVDVSGLIKREDFSLAKHRVIFQRMEDLHQRGEPIGRVEVANELMRYGELESVDGLSYIISLDDGLPQLFDLTSYTKVVGEHSRARQIAFIGQSIVNKALLRDPPADIVKFGFSQLMGITDPADRTGLTPASAVIENYEGGINAFLCPERQEIGIKTGFVGFDRMTGGLHERELIVIGARPSMGKTSWAMQVAYTSARRGTPAAVFSLEMSKESLLQRLVASAARVDLQRFRQGYSSDDERRALRRSAGEIHGSPLFIDDEPRLGIMEMHSKLTRLMAEMPIGLVVVDYLQLMQVTGRSTRNEDVSEVSRGLKLMASELSVPIIALSQLSRAVETRQGDHRPMLADLRDSGSLEQDADLVGFIFREEVYKRDREDLKGLAELILAKQRNGPVGKVDLVFLHSQVRFENRAEDLEEYAGQ